MTCNSGPKTGAEWRMGSSKTLYGELKRFLVELGLACALVMVLAQTFPAFANTLNGWTPVCTSAGISMVKASADDPAPSPDCKRCPLCLTNHTTYGGLPTKGSDATVAGQIGSVLELRRPMTRVVLPDHLLPFSGAPPPAISVDIMQHNLIVPVSLAPTNSFFMPGFASWH